uniref:Uncharacterized protein n=1 Tax=Siphoviridae sp. ctnpt50 TaxID=2827941 RepID=A0A8S5SDQ0_9CAUD|nr:MAG TPA: hypothetical protein [Siphoviridae sp. ctnpt50]
MDGIGRAKGSFSSGVMIMVGVPILRRFSFI